MAKCLNLRDYRSRNDSSSELGSEARKLVFRLLVIASTISPVILSSACSNKEDRRETVSFDSITPQSGMSFTPHKVLIQGKNLHVFEDVEKAGSKKITSAKKRHDYRLEMWTGSSQRLGRGFSLENVSLEKPNMLSATVPPGVYAGSYRLVIRQGRRMKFTSIKYLVREQQENRDTPRLERISPSVIRSGDPARLMFMGANLIGTIRIALEGPLPERRAPILKLLRKNYKMGWPLQDVKKRYLHEISNLNPARVSGSVPEYLPPGRYTIKISTTTHEGHQLDTENMLTVKKPEEGMPESVLNYLIYFAVLGTVFLLGMIMAWRQKDVGLENREQRLNLLWMVGGLLFYVVLIGSIQFYFARLF